MIEPINRQILSAYPERFHTEDEDIVRLDPSCSLGRCRHWRVRTADENFCLRQWPAGTPKKERLQFVQAVLWHAMCEGIDFIPLPFETRKNKGFVEWDGCYWELLPWIAGVEDENGSFEEFHFSDDEFLHLENIHAEIGELKMFQTVSAMMSLAQFHLAVATFPLPNFPMSTSPGIRDELTGWEMWIAGKFSHLFHVLRSSENFSSDRLEIRLAELGLTLLNHAVRESGRSMVLLTRAARLSVPIQPVIANAHRRHLRFDENGVCGILDMKKIAIDGVSLDIASLLGSIAESDPALWNLGIKAYRQLRELSDEELYLIEAFERSRLFLEGLGYLERFFLCNDIDSEYQLREICYRLNRILRRLDDEKRSRNVA